ncbi:MAG TPA: class I SAM-dependent methyltransferase, partial [Gemmatimonadales bacterium]|nr:class I SAM-dependent methyltransferase [Gemmatimonadales bacterium]
ESLEAAHAREVARGERFQFGSNWLSFLRTLNAQRIAEAERGLGALLGTADLSGMTFLDVGSGSGLSSLVARRLGASVRSFDYDPQSVACTEELRRRYFPEDPAWRVEAGSALDEQYLATLPQFDIVHSWGVLHHTGKLWKGIELVSERVRPGGRLALAIYNDQGAWSNRWRRIKRFYCSGSLGRVLVTGSIIPYWVLRQLAADLFWRRNPLTTYREHHKSRGMSVVHDWLDWLGGYPFEVAKPEEVLAFLLPRGFTLRRLTTCGGSIGCNEFVFIRGSTSSVARRPDRERQLQG